MDFNVIIASSVLSLFLKSPIQRRNSIIYFLETINATEYKVLNYPDEFDVENIKKCVKCLTKIHHLFPTVFSQTTIQVDYKVTLLNKSKLIINKLDYGMSTSEYFLFSSYKFSNISLALQLLCYNIQIKKEYTHIQDLEPSSTALFLNQQLKEGYSNGQLIDYIDNLFDQYKHTLISPKCFHKLFISFGCNTSEIGNKAFDLYIESRDSRSSWINAISYYLIHNFKLTSKLATKISVLLLDD